MTNSTVKCCILSAALLAGPLLPLSAEPANGGPPKLRLNLRDGANFSGTPTTNAITILTSYARIDVPFKDIDSIVPGKDRVVSVFFPNGDVLRGTSAVDKIRFKTEFGTMAIGLRHIKTLAIPANAKFPDWINDGLVAHYRFDGNADDISGHKYHGSVHGAEPATDRFNNPKRSYRIRDKNFIMLNNRSFHGLRDFTVSVWVYFDKLNTGGNNPGNSITSVATPGTINEFVLAHDIEGNGLGMNLKGGQHGWHEFEHSALEARKWHHIVFVRTLSNVSLYVDGQEKDSTVAQPAATAADHTGVILGQKQSSIGGGFQANQGLAGKIDDLRIYSLALSAAKVKRLHEAEKKEY